MNKALLLERIRDALRADLAEARRLAKETAQAANHPEARPENDKDTRKIELSYLAAGQASRAAELDASLSLLGALEPAPFDGDKPLRAGALVALDIDGKPERVFLSPAGGGLTIADGDSTIRVVTPSSPLGRALLGKTVGDAFEFDAAGRRRDVEIVGVE
jgi:hypothetical protein